MATREPSNLPWLERLTIAIPGYAGYALSPKTREIDQNFRDAISARLGIARTWLDQTITQFKVRAELLDRPELTEAQSLERIREHLDSIQEQLNLASSWIDENGPDSPLSAEKANTLLAIDHELFERANTLVDHFEQPDPSHDFLAHVEDDLVAIDKLLNQRAFAGSGKAP